MSSEVVLSHSFRTTQVPRPEPMRGISNETPIEQAPPPAYSTEYGQVDFSQDGFDTRAKVSSMSFGCVSAQINADIAQAMGVSTSISIRSQEGFQTSWYRLCAAS